jgi:hypothetical protein
LGDKVPAAVRAQLNELKREVAEGSISVIPASYTRG